MYKLLQDDMIDFFRNEGKSGLKKILSNGLQSFTHDILKTAKPKNRVRFLVDYVDEIKTRNKTQMENFLVLISHKVQISSLGEDEEAHRRFNWEFIELPSAQGNNIFSNEHLSKIQSVSATQPKQTRGEKYCSMRISIEKFYFLLLT